MFRAYERVRSFELTREFHFHRATARVALNRKWNWNFSRWLERVLYSSNHKNKYIHVCIQFVLWKVDSTAYHTKSIILMETKIYLFQLKLSEHIKEIRGVMDLANSVIIRHGMHPISNCLKRTIYSPKINKCSK